MREPTEFYNFLVNQNIQGFLKYTLEKINVILHS